MAWLSKPSKMPRVTIYSPPRSMIVDELIGGVHGRAIGSGAHLTRVLVSSASGHLIAHLERTDQLPPRARKKKEDT